MFNPVQTLTIKQGNSFSFVVSYTDEGGALLTLDDAIITADIKNNRKGKVATLNAVKLSDSTFELSLPVGVKLPPMALYMDIRLEQGGTVRNSDTLQINVSEVVTNG